MATYNQINRKSRKRKEIYSRTKSLMGSPQKKGICIKVYTTSPKKPNSAVRKVVKVFIQSNKRYVIAAIKGIGHSISNFSQILVHGGRVRDIPGVHYKAIRGKLDFLAAESVERFKSRSKYGKAKRRF